MWALLLPMDVEKSIQQRIYELLIIERNQLGWDKINKYFTGSQYVWMTLHLSEHITDWQMEHHCITRFPKLMPTLSSV